MAHAMNAIGALLLLVSIGALAWSIWDLQWRPRQGYEGMGPAMKWMFFTGLGIVGAAVAIGLLIGATYVA